MAYLYTDVKGPDLSHPDSAIRLASVVHRFKVPKITFAVSFAKSFSSTGRSDKTRKIMLSADDARQRLQDAVTAPKISAERVIAEATRYQPMIHSILLSCKVQPEQARLDERLMFVWKSGIEDKPDAFSSEAMMYDFVMVCVSEAMGQAILATEKSVTGDFVGAAQGYAAAAGIFDFLAEDHLPKWIAKGSSVDNDKLPAECHVPVAKALALLFMANGQQMAVATVLMKEGEPNYSLLSKLCLGIAEQLEDFVSLLRRDGFTQMSRLDPDFLTLVTLQTSVQKALSLYFHARSLWSSGDYGLAIAMASEATVALKQREHTAAPGVPDVNQTPSLKPLADDLKNLRSHMALLLRAWEKDNSNCYFALVPRSVSASSKLREGIQMKKKTEYKLQEAEPVLLALPEHALQRSDSDLARDMQRRLNCGEDTC